MAEEDVVNNSNVELANHIIDIKVRKSNIVCTWFKDHRPELCIPPDHNELELNLIATTREGADALKEFYAHISKKRNKDFRQGKSSPFIRCISIYSKVGYDVQSFLLSCVLIFSVLRIIKMHTHIISKRYNS